MSNATRSPGSNKLEVRVASDGTKKGVCNLISIAPFSVVNSESTSSAANYSLNSRSYENAFAIALAIKHLNEGDGFIIEAVEGLKDKCNIDFVGEFIDTEDDAVTAARRVYQRLLESNSDVSTHEYAPCAFIGATSSNEESVQTSVVANLDGYSMVSGMSTGTALDHETNYPKFARTIPSSVGPAGAFVRYVEDKLGHKFLVILNSDDDFSNDYASKMREASNSYKDFTLQQIYVKRDGSNIQEAIKELKDLRITAMFATFEHTSGDNNMYDAVMEEAYKQEIAGNGKHIWFYPRSILEHSTSYIAKQLLGEEFQESPLHHAYQGAGVVLAGDWYSSTYIMNSMHKKLVDGMKKMAESPKDMAFMESILPNPINNDANATKDLMHRDSFLNTGLLDYRVQFLYEATILAGLAACSATTDDLYLDGDDFYNKLVRTHFTGISGLVTLDNVSGSRHTNSTDYPIVNIRSVENTNTSSTNNRFGFEYIPTNQLIGGERWNDLELFEYNDRTNTQPEEVWKLNIEIEYANTAVIAISSIFYILSIAVAVVCAVWTFQHKDTRIVRASQAFFLYLICIGTMIFATTMVPLIIDSSTKLTNDGISASCNSGVWFFFTGFSITSSAFYSKLRRINKIMKNSLRCRRIEVTVRNSIVPVVVTLSLNIFILSLMTAMSPIKEEVNLLTVDQFGRTTTVYETCDQWNDLGYIIPLLVINIGIFCLAMYEAWQARNLSTEFQESQSIFRALVGTFVAYFIGGPVLFLVDDMQVHLFIVSAVIFVMCVFIQGFLFVPKYMYQEKQAMAAVGGTTNGNNGVKSSSIVTIDNSHVGAPSTTVPHSNGEKFLSNKNRQQLARENDQLRKKVNMLEKVDKLRKRITKQNSDNVDDDDDDDDDRDEKVIESNSDLDSAET